jgi:hypothetical protein
MGGRPLLQIAGAALATSQRRPIESKEHDMTAPPQELQTELQAHQTPNPDPAPDPIGDPPPMPVGDPPLPISPDPQPQPVPGPDQIPPPPPMPG